MYLSQEFDNVLDLVKEKVYEYMSDFEKLNNYLTKKSFIVC